MKYSVTINGQELSIEKTNGKTLINGKEQPYDLIRVDEDEFHLISGGVGYTLRVVAMNKDEKKLELLVNGKKAQVSIKNENDLLLAQLGMETKSAQKNTDLKAPMPGLVVDILVSPGQQVKKGDAIVILEAMKMENVLKAVTDVEIQSIEISKGKPVEKNQILIKYKS